MSRSERQETIYGRNPVRETLRAQRRELHSLVLQSGMEPSAVIDEILRLAEGLGLAVETQDREMIDRQAANHQGVLLRSGPYPFCELTDMLDLASASGEPAMILLLDQLQDPQNFGTLLRSAEAVGVHGVLVPAHHAVGVTPAVVSASSGACEHLQISRQNLAQAMRTLKQEGVWLAGLEAGQAATPLEQADLRGPIGLVVGSEGTGLRALVRSSCDFMLAIPMRGRLGSLNAAVAGSLALYRIWEQRGYQR